MKILIYHNSRCEFAYTDCRANWSFVGTFVGQCLQFDPTLFSKQIDAQGRYLIISIPDIILIYLTFCVFSMKFSFGFEQMDGLRGWNEDLNDGFIVFYSIRGDMINKLGVDCV